MKVKLRQLLAQRQKQPIVNANLTPSAVLLPIYEKQGQYHILFIKRSEKVKEHQGQISFPGGTRDEGDRTLLDTALRECAEEIGLRSDDIEVLGELDDAVTVTSNYVVTPFVARIPWPYHFKLNGDEVDKIIEVPLPALLDRNCRHQKTEIWNGEEVDASAYHYREWVIWGATARILYSFLDIFKRAMTDGETFSSPEHNP